MRRAFLWFALPLVLALGCGGTTTAPSAPIVWRSNAPIAVPALLLEVWADERPAVLTHELVHEKNSYGAWVGYTSDSQSDDFCVVGADRVESDWVNAGMSCVADEVYRNRGAFISTSNGEQSFTVVILPPGFVGQAVYAVSGSLDSVDVEFVVVADEFLVLRHAMPELGKVAFTLECDDCSTTMEI